MRQGGAEAAIYRKYLPLFEKFLRKKAKHDIDGDGKLWCEKSEWVAYLCPLIEEDDGNAIAHLHCGSNAETSLEMSKLIRQGKEYICHRLYNMGFLKNIERRKTGRNVSHFRYLQQGEVATPPVPDAIYLLKKVFIDEGKLVRRVYQLTLDRACDLLLSRLNGQKFPDDISKMEEWQRVISTLVCQGVIKIKGDFYEFSPQKKK